MVSLVVLKSFDHITWQITQSLFDAISSAKALDDKNSIMNRADIKTGNFNGLQNIVLDPFTYQCKSI
jgi:hypothetical protein